MPIAKSSRTRGFHVDRRLSNRHRQRCGLTVKGVSRIFSSFLLPLLLSIFTIVFAIYQQNLSNSNRSVDLEMAREQRKQDQQMSQEQRAADMKATAQQRSEDQEVAQRERNQDRFIAQIERDTIQNLSSTKQAQELFLAEQIRHTSGLQHQEDLAIAENTKQETILSTFIHEVSLLIFDDDDSMNISRNNATVIRWKMLTAVRQLDSQLKTILFKFLLENHLLAFERWQKKLPVLDLAHANFDYLNLSNPDRRSGQDQCDTKLVNFAMIDASVMNANFDHTCLENVTFGRTILTNTSFRHAQLHRVNFVGSILIGANFEGAQLSSCDFSVANLKESNLSDEQLQHGASFIAHAILPNGTGAKQPSQMAWLTPKPCLNETPVFDTLHFWHIERDSDERAANATILLNQIEETGECQFEARARYRVGMQVRVTIGDSIEIKEYLLNSRVGFRGQMDCFSYGKTTISHFVKCFDSSGTLLHTYKSGVYLSLLFQLIQTPGSE